MKAFVGVDLAWKTNEGHSAVVVLRGNDTGATVTTISDGIDTFGKVKSFILENCLPDTVIAIDAPLIIKNPINQRLCELEISKEFGSRHASAHSTNLTLYPDPLPVKLAIELSESGFCHLHELSQAQKCKGKWLFEVYPHAAQVVLFDLPCIIKYKKGSTASRRIGLTMLRNKVWAHFTIGQPRLEPNDLLRSLVAQDLQEIKGEKLKAYEDKLDACVCAYLAMYYWYWGSKRNKRYGDLANGYIINPTTPLLSAVVNTN